MITIGIKNVPEGVAYWIPIFYVDDEEIYPDYLPVWQAWGTREIGDTLADLLIQLYDESRNFLFVANTGVVEFIDNTNYVFNWETRELEISEKKAAFPILPVVLGAGVLAAAIFIMKPK